MGHHRTARLAAVSTTASAFVLLALVADAMPYVAVAGMIVGLAALLAALKLWHHNCLESRLTAATAALTAAGCTVIVSTVGLPGSEPRPIDGAALALLSLGLAVPALLSADRLRRSPVTTSPPPYAL